MGLGLKITYKKEKINLTDFAIENQDEIDVSVIPLAEEKEYTAVPAPTPTAPVNWIEALVALVGPAALSGLAPIAALTGLFMVLSAKDVGLSPAREQELIQKYYQDEAIKARDQLVTEVRTWSAKKRDDITAIAAGYNKKTGDIVAAAKSTLKHGNAVCVEDLVASLLMAKGANLDDIIMTPAIRPRNLVVIPVCKRCQTKYKKENFIPGTPFL